MKIFLLALCLMNIAPSVLAEPLAPAEYTITSLNGKLLHSLVINGVDQLDCELGHIRIYSINGTKINFVTHLNFRSQEQCHKVERCLEAQKVSEESPIVLRVNHKNKVRVNGLDLPSSCESEPN